MLPTDEFSRSRQSTKPRLHSNALLIHREENPAFVSIFELCSWLEKTSIGTAVRESDWQFPVIESIHVLALTCLVSASAAVDFRLLGVGAKREPVSQVLTRLVPIAWVGFGICLLTGSLMFLSEATKCYASLFFRTKLVLLLLAGVNALLFHSIVYPKVAKWDETGRTPTQARVAAYASLLLWVCIVFAGRGIAYL